MTSFSRTLFLLTLLLGLGVSLYADIDDSPNEVAYQLRIQNTDDFSNYEFFVLTQDWDRTQQIFLDGVHKPVKGDKPVDFSGLGYDDWVTLGGKTYIYAKHKKTGELSVSDERVGGALSLDYRFYRAVEEVKILSIEKGRIRIENKGVFQESFDGSKKQPYKGDLGLGGLLWFYMTLPVVCLGMLVFYFVKRRRKAVS